MSTEPVPSPNRLIEVNLDQASISSANPNIEQEREVAVFDLIEGNSFAVAGRDDGPFRLALSISEERLVMAIDGSKGGAPLTHAISLAPFKRILKDYFMVCDSYYAAIKTSPPSRIQAIDMGRRSLHDDGSRLLVERFEDKITVDFDTARRLFTLLCALHWKG